MFAEGPEWQPEGEADLCESCGREPASVHVVRVEGGEISQSHVCQECAGDTAQQSGGPALVFALPLYLSGVRPKEQTRSLSSIVGRSDLRCEYCGTTFTDLAETGLLGCAECYGVFAEHLTPSDRGGEMDDPAEHPHLHAGKVPSRAPAGLQQRREVVRLTRMLRELVETERFEEAARVRDRLLELGHDPGRGRS